MERSLDQLIPAEERRRLKGTLEGEAATTTVKTRRGGNLFATLVVGTLGMSVMVPSLMLQGLATSSRRSTGEDQEPEPEAQASEGPPAVSEPVEIFAHRANPDQRNEIISAERDTSSGSAEEAESAHRPRRPHAKAIVPGIRETTDGRDDSSALAQPQELHHPQEQNGKTKFSALTRWARRSAESPPVDQTGDTSSDPASEAQAEAEAAESARSEPVTLEEIQAAQTTAAESFKELRLSLDEAYRIISRLNVERYEAQAELALVKGTPAPERPPEFSSFRPGHHPRRNRVGPRALVEEDVVHEDEVRAIARRRQMIVGGVLLSIAITFVLYQVLNWTWFPSGFGRDALMQMAGIGVFMQILFMGFIVMRLASMTSRGRNWLFPTPQQEAMKRRRKRMQGR